MLRAEDRVRSEVIRLAGPAIVQSLIQTAIFIADRVILGRYSTEALAALQIASPVAWTIYAVFTAFSAGTVAVVGRSCGAGDLPAARAAARASLAGAFTIGLLVAVVGVLVIRPTLAVLYPRAQPGVMALALDYLRIVLCAMPFLYLTTLGSSVLQGAGDTRTPMLVGGVANVVKVVLGIFLVFGVGPAPELGMAGAAYASVVAFTFEGLGILVALLRPGGRLNLFGPTAPWRVHVRRVARVSAPAFAERIVYHAGMTVFFTLIGLLGKTAMAANQALISIESISFLSADGFGIAAAAIVALRLGAGKPEEAERGARTAVRLAVIALTLFGVVFALGGRPLVAAFTAQGSVQAMGARALFFGALAQPFMAITIVTSDALRGAGDTRSVVLVSFVGAVVVRLTATWLLAIVLHLGLPGVWLGSSADWAVRALLLWMIFRRGAWRQRVV